MSSPPAAPAAPTPAQRGNIQELAWLFLRLGLTAFGGPAAHVGVMEDEVVRRRRWLTHQEFLDLLGATNLIPGPNSTEMAIHIGHRRAGWPGLLVAGTCFIVPAALITLALAWAYVRYGQRPEALALMYGVKPVMIGIVAQALWFLGRAAVRTWSLGALALVAAAASAVGVHEIAVLLAAGVVSVIVGRAWQGGGCHAWALLAGATAPVAAAAGAGALPFSLAALFLFFLKVGAILFGSGYVLLAFLQEDLVDRWGWLTSAQLLDAVALGQVTPGPVSSTATFIGYVLAGVPGAVAATVGIFLPAFVFVALSGPLVPRLRRSPLTARFLDGVNAGALALMAVVTVTLGRAAVVDVISAMLAIGSVIALLRFRTNSTWLVLIGAGVGLLSSWWR